MRYENLSKRLNRYTILFLIMDLIILLIDLGLTDTLVTC